MKLIKFAIVALTLVLGGYLTQQVPAGPTHRIDPDRYAAIAYSPSTGNYGYGWDCGSLTRARSLALANCHGDDARVLTWVRFGWAALVIADDGAYGYAEVHGAGVTDGDAVREARAHLRKHCDRPIRTIVIVCSGDVDPQIIKVR